MYLDKQLLFGSKFEIKKNNIELIVGSRFLFFNFSGNKFLMIQTNKKRQLKISKRKISQPSPKTRDREKKVFHIV
jgi:hypothetical protein